MNYLRNIFLNKSMHCRIYESLKVLGIRIRPLELYLRTPFRTSFFSLRDVILNHRISAYYNTKSKVEKLWRAFRRRRSKIIITHFRITSNSTENMVSSRKDLKLLCNPSCDFQNLFRLGAAINFDRYANENSLPPPPAARRLAPARSACRGFISFDLKPKQKDTRRCLFVLNYNAVFDTGCKRLQSCILCNQQKIRFL